MPLRHQRCFLFWLLQWSTLWIAVVSAKTKPAEQNATQAASLYDTIQSDMKTVTDMLEENKDQLVRDMEAHKEQAKRNLEESMGLTRSYVDYWGDTAYTAMRQAQQRFRNHILKDVLQQRVGWERLRHGIRDHLGLIVGCVMVFAGYSNPRLANGGAIALQASQLSWVFLQANDLLPHSPWLYDATAIFVGLVSYLQLPETQICRLLPPIFLSVALFQSTSLVMEEWNGANDQTGPPSLVKAVIITALAYWSVKLCEIPVPLASTSISGAYLVYDSVRTEVAGNWYYMVKRAAKMALPAVAFTRHVFKPVSRRILWLWRKRKAVLASITTDSDNAIVRLIARLGHFLATNVGQPLAQLRTRIQNNPTYQTLVDFLKRVRKACKPLAWHWFIAIWGILVQMGFITNPGKAMQAFQISLNPIKFFAHRFESRFQWKSYVKKFVNHRVVATIQSGAKHISSAAARIRTGVVGLIKGSDQKQQGSETSKTSSRWSRRGSERGRAVDVKKRRFR